MVSAVLGAFEALIVDLIVRFGPVLIPLSKKAARNLFKERRVGFSIPDLRSDGKYGSEVPQRCDPENHSVRTSFESLGRIVSLSVGSRVAAMIC